MGINLVDASYTCYTVTRTFETGGQFTGDHHYLAINRDEHGAITGCRNTKDRNERASLSEINEFANICFQQYNSENDPTLLNNIKNIKNCLEVIQTNVNENKDQNCLSGLWFLLKLGSSILAATNDIILKMSDIAESPVVEALIEKKRNETVADEALEKAKGHEKLGDKGPALSYYKIAAKNGNLEAILYLIECYETGKLGQKQNPQEHSQYYLKAAGKYRELDDQDAFSDAYRKAFELAPEQTLLYIIKHWHMDITTLFTMEETQLAAQYKIAGAYALNVRTYIDQRNWERAREQCRYLNPFDPMQVTKLIVEIGKSSSTLK